MKREGNTYTAQTLELLNEEYPEDKFYFIIGADSLFQLETWYHPEKVMELTSLLVSGREYDRAGRTLDQQISHLKSVYGAHIQVLHNPEMNVASARIRDMAARLSLIHIWDLPQRTHHRQNAPLCKADSGPPDIQLQTLFQILWESGPQSGGSGTDGPEGR